jgi:hypothetical protein
MHVVGPAGALRAIFFIIIVTIWVDLRRQEQEQELYYTQSRFFFLPMNETSSVAFVFSGGAPAAPCDEAITFSIIKNTISCGSELN